MRGVESIILKVPDPHKNTVSSFQAHELKHKMKVKKYVQKLTKLQRKAICIHLR